MSWKDGMVLNRLWRVVNALKRWARGRGRQQRWQQKRQIKYHEYGNGDKNKDEVARIHIGRETWTCQSGVVHVVKT